MFFSSENVNRVAPAFLEEQPDGTYPYRKGVVEKIRQNGSTGHEIQHMLDKHNEVALIINAVHGTTFNREQLNADTDNETQAFNWDIWVEFDDAVRFYPNDPTKQAEYVHARTMLTVATAMALLGPEGDLEVVLRTA
jgi:hypothetical protein